MTAWTGELTVYEVAGDGQSVRVDLVGGDASVCGSLLYEFDDDLQAQRNLAILSRWRDAGVTVLALREDDVVTLIDPRAVVENFLDDLFVEP